jgi:hypothetical protein
MRVVEISAFGKPEVLRLAERPQPQPGPGPGEALIRVHASGVNRPDVLQRLGKYPPPPGASDTPGLEVAGVIEGGDAGALAEAGFQVGDRVCALVAGGGYAEYCVAPVAQCLPVPEGLSDAQAASLPETFFTVWSNVFDRGRLHGRMREQIVDRLAQRRIGLRHMVIEDLIDRRFRRQPGIHENLAHLVEARQIGVAGVPGKGLGCCARRPPGVDPRAHIHHRLSRTARPTPRARRMQR